MGHWTPTAIEPMDYDDDDCNSNFTLKVLCTLRTMGCNSLFEVDGAILMVGGCYIIFWGLVPLLTNSWRGYSPGSPPGIGTHAKNANISRTFSKSVMPPKQKLPVDKNGNLDISAMFKKQGRPNNSILHL